jgi:hypothetical protein
MNNTDRKQQAVATARGKIREALGLLETGMTSVGAADVALVNAWRALMIEAYQPGETMGSDDIEWMTKLKKERVRIMRGAAAITNSMRRLQRIKSACGV